LEVIINEKKNIGEIIKNFREKNEIKQIEFCKKINNIISPSTLSLIERNKKELSKEVKEKIEESFSLLLPKANNEYVEKLIQLRKEKERKEEKSRVFLVKEYENKNIKNAEIFENEKEKVLILKFKSNNKTVDKIEKETGGKAEVRKGRNTFKNLLKEYNLKQKETETEVNKTITFWKKETIAFNKENENNKIDKKEETFAPNLSLFSNNQEIKKTIFENKIENVFQFQEIIEMLEKIEQEVKNLTSKENVINYFKKLEISKEEKKQTLEEILKIYYQN